MLARQPCCCSLEKQYHLLFTWLPLIMIVAATKTLWRPLLLACLLTCLLTGWFLSWFRACSPQCWPELSREQSRALFRPLILLLHCLLPLWSRNVRRMLYTNAQFALYRFLFLLRNNSDMFYLIMRIITIIIQLFEWYNRDGNYNTNSRQLQCHPPVYVNFDYQETLCSDNHPNHAKRFDVYPKHQLDYNQRTQLVSTHHSIARFPFCELRHDQIAPPTWDFPL